jgi:hypothetical protein
LNGSGQLGIGTPNRDTPIKIMDNIVSVAAGGNHSLVIRKDGSLWSWGHGEFGQLGNGTFTNSNTPVRVMLDDVRMQPITPGTVMGNVLHTDVTATINGQIIPSFNINGNTMIIVEDLRSYGFDVTWNGDTRTLRVGSFDPDRPVTPKPVETVNLRPGTIRFSYIATDIKTLVNGVEIESFNIRGQTIIKFDYLSAYGNVRIPPQERSA